VSEFQTPCSGQKNSLFRAEQGIRQNPLAGNGKKGLARIENGSDQGNVENIKNIFPLAAARSLSPLFGG
jgi:hypothetical protein